MARDFSTFSEDNANEKEEEEEDYIDIEVSPSSSSAFFCYSITSPHPREFEFQMSSKSLERDLTTSPADELFYKGNLLPLHLPPRLQMVQKLLNNNNNSNSNSTNYEKKSAADEDENFTTPLTTTHTTPFESCNISPADSCRVSRELNRDEYFLECSTEMSGFIDENPKKSWSKKLKLIRKSSLGLKLKASSAYLKSLFSKSGCSEESCAESAKNIHERAISKTKECLNKYIKVGKKNPFGQIQKGIDQIEIDSIRGTDKEKMIEDNGSHRRSFSGAIKRHSATKSSSSLSSSGSSSSMISSTSSNGFFELHMLKRSNSANSEIETSIQGAIAHCKQSQQIFCSRKNQSEVGFCSFSASKIAACEEQERPQICRG